MADTRFYVGFSSACKQARLGGGLPGCEPGLSPELLIPLAARARRCWLPPDLVRLIDALVRRLEHEDALLAMNDGELGRTLCEAAAAGGLLDVRFLLSRGADVEAATKYVSSTGFERNKTAVQWAAEGGYLEVTGALLDAGAQRIDIALYNACFSGHTPVVALLLDRGADIHVQNDTPLGVAGQNAHLATATLLLDRGADVHALIDAPLVTAAQRGHTEMVRLLLDRGADLRSR